MNESLVLENKNSVEYQLNQVDYEEDQYYVPSAFALEFINFIKLVNGSQGEEHKSPVLHYKMLSDTASPDIDKIANMVFRGAAKTTLFAEYLFLYLGVYGVLPGLGKVILALYVSDSIENGVKNMRKNLEYRWENSEFLQEYIPKVRFTDVRWEFRNIDGNVFIVKGYGAKTGVRGSKEQATRPNLAILDDLVSDEDAKSPTVIKNIENTVYKAINYALHPSKSKIIWSGTPFNAKDPLYKAVESGAWKTNVYPVCTHFPCSEEDFRSAWPDRFNYNYVQKKYSEAQKLGELESFNQELMLRIMAEEDRLILNSDIGWYKRSTVLANLELFNYYITTDFAVSEKESADFSVISVWALSNIGHWYWVDGICKKQLMNKNIQDLFRLAQKYQPQGVGVEISGQQKGFISWIQDQMIIRNNFFNLASDKHSNEPGIRPNTNKMVRFNIVVPWFKAHMMHFPIEMKDDLIIQECLNELTLASPGGFKSKNDDFIDNISMLGSLQTWRPSEPAQMSREDDLAPWEIENSDEDVSSLDSYIV